MKATPKTTIVALVLALAASTLGPTLAAAAEGKVNINTATADELARLPRVGPAIAGRIVEFRDANGQFKAPEELMLVRGIGEKTFEDLEPYVALEGETTLDEKVRVSSLGEDEG